MKKCVTLLLTVILISSISPTVFALENAEQQGVGIDNNGVSSYLRVVDENSFEITDENGKTSLVYVDENNNFYIDGVLAVSSDEFNQMVEVTKSNAPVFMTRAAADWYYLDTYSYSVDFQNRTRTILLGVISIVVPFIGPGIGLGTILDACLNQGAPGMYIKVSRYYSKGNQFYKYCYHFYSDRAMRNQVAYREEIKKMW